MFLAVVNHMIKRVRKHIVITELQSNVNTPRKFPIQNDSFASQTHIRGLNGFTHVRWLSSRQGLDAGQMLSEFNDTSYVKVM